MPSLCRLPAHGLLPGAGIPPGECGRCTGGRRGLLLRLLLLCRRLSLRGHHPAQTDGSVGAPLVNKAKVLVMSKDNDTGKPTRKYPPFYERVVPIALGIILLAIVILLVVALAVVTGLFPGAG